MTVDNWLAEKGGSKGEKLRSVLVDHDDDGHGLEDAAAGSPIGPCLRSGKEGTEVK